MIRRYYWLPSLCSPAIIDGVSTDDNVRPGIKEIKKMLQKDRVCLI